MPYSSTVNAFYGTNGDDKIWSRGTATPGVSTNNDWIFGYAGNDILCGNEGNDAIDGSDGNDFLQGGPGSDRAYGGAGDDIIMAGQGSDIIDGGSGANTISYRFAAQGATVRVGSGIFQTGPYSDTVTNIQNVGGSDYGDKIAVTGSGSADGGAGNDVLVAAGGAKIDQLKGGDGNDVCYIVSRTNWSWSNLASSEMVPCPDDSSGTTGTTSGGGLVFTTG